MDIVFRVAKSLIMAAIMMAAAWVLTGSARIAVVAALVPFILGIVNIMTNVAYGLTAAVFMVAVAVQIIGEDTISEGRAYAEEFIQNAKIMRPAKEPKANIETKVETNGVTTTK
jgi:hypothetical protein